MQTIPLLGVSQQTISGKVTSNEDGALIGATVRIMNSTLGAVTDLEGNFELQAVPQDARIVFSYLGY